ncbi:hypothetical protein PENSTE_c031G01598 [Penicillium steckii]|uniref:aldehyde dehydrogenase (NAD(+)) n=1 Tax=Penicillium steckii TaxID=303698 RepID=A0A1V6SLL2_9EURO|nr:hypothetical protein PENSTE_c031G01598 [Penicillium steckii]
MFSLSSDGKSVINHTTKENCPTECPKDSDLALRTLAVNVEDDMFLLVDTPEGHHTVAFVCCFPNGFDPSTKLGKTMDEIHAPVPHYEKIGPSMERYFKKLAVGKSIKRLNWSISIGKEIYNSSGNHINHIGKKSVFVEDEDVDILETNFRVELQTLTRLPRTKAILFSFKTYIYSIEDVKEEGLGPELADAIEGFRKGNAPEFWTYKGAKLESFTPEQYITRRTMSCAVILTLPTGRQYQQPTGLFINNNFLKASGETIHVIDPATERNIISIQGASQRDVDVAVAAAREAFHGEWRAFSATQRGEYLYRLADLIYRDRELIASIDAWDNGKPYSSTLNGDLDESYNVFRYYAGWADKITGRTIETSPTKLAYVLQEPIGVCGQIIPWNYPFMMLAWKVAPALACGNVVVLKPAEQTPLSALYFGQLILEAGFPAGVVNIVPGLGSVAGKSIAEHTGIDKVAFTGSTNTGRAIMKSAASNLKNITLECGGKSPSLVFADADLEQAVKWCHLGIMDNQGQVCTSTSRIYVHQDIYDRFVNRFVEVTKENAKIGNAFTEGIFQGPQISSAQHEKILSYIKQGQEQGAQLVYGGKEIESTGYFIEPTVFVDTTEDMGIVREEIFGPVVVICKFATEEEAIRKANATSYGLAAAIFSEKISRAHIVASKLEAGMVWINSSGDSHYAIPFGGYKSSGIGRELGSYALDAYTQSKAVHVNLRSAP